MPTTMTSIGITSNLDNDNSKEEFRTKTYEMLSSEFQELCPKVARAHQLAAHMYDRLTLIEKLSHKEARSKIINDHKHIPGFSDRNVRRCLPSNNPNVPHRVRPSWPKSSITNTSSNTKLDILKHKQAENTVLNNNTEQDNVESSDVLTSNQKDPLSPLQTEKPVQILSNSHICPECEKLVVESNQQIRMLEEALKEVRLLSTTRKYTKSELSSHSRNDKEKKLVDSAEENLPKSSYPNSSDLNNSIQMQTIDEERDDRSNESCTQRRELKETRPTTSSAIAKMNLRYNEIGFEIPKEKYPEIKIAMNNNRNCFYLIFDANTGSLLRSVSELER
ncbi:MAG: hypothetical protein WBQ25_10980 [Nitrososphaeraceae archaeon]